MGKGGQWTLPERLPDFGRRSLLVFRLIWFPAFLLALLGPVAGTWQRLSEGGQNSALVPGSRAGLALAAGDLTRIRFPVGPVTAAAGVRAGDKIVAIDGIPLSKAVPTPGEGTDLPAGTTEADYALLGELLYGTESRDTVLRLRTPAGQERDLAVTTGEQHVEQGAGAYSIPAWLLRFADLLHLPTYPLLLASAWVLFRRKQSDVVSSVVSLAILLTMIAEQPSATFLALVLGVPEWVHRIVYDLGNILLLGGILLFPFGRLTPRWVLAVLAALPVLLFVEGDMYRGVFIGFMGLSVLTLLRRLKATPSSDERQQLKWALLGFAGYSLFLAVSLGADMLKLTAGAFSEQLILEVVAGFAFGIAFLLLQLGLLVALMKYRLYDAESVITRSASVALITLVLGAGFAAIMEGVKEVVLAGFGRDAGSIAPIVGAAISTVLVSPIYERIQKFTEKRFHRHLVALRHDLPECLRDLRHFAPLTEIVGEVLARIEAGVRPRRIAFAVEGQVIDARGVTAQEVQSWLALDRPIPRARLEFEPADKLFSIRLPLRAEEGPLLGWVLVGARPDRSCLSTAERDALEEIIDPVARAVRLVLKREARERGTSNAIAALQNQIQDLRTRLAAPRAGAAA
ncbi:MAG TPA: hypothetical protein VGB62_10125 [Allosphingosinicella sp.]|jgi:hypothetical protein